MSEVSNELCDPLFSDQILEVLSQPSSMIIRGQLSIFVLCYITRKWLLNACISS